MIKLTLIQGDALKILPKLPDKSIDLVVTDPPYNILSSVPKNNIQNMAKEWDTFTSIEQYKNFTTNYLQQLERISKNNSSLFIFWSEKHLFIFPEVLEKTNLKLYKILIWHYPNILKGFSNKRWHNTFDFIFHLVKGDRPRTFNASFTKEENKDVWVFPKPQHNFKKDKKLHSTQKPLELIKRIIILSKNYSGALATISSLVLIPSL